MRLPTPPSPLHFRLAVLRPLGRSGSMFVHTLLDGHENILLLPITFPFYYFWDLYHSTHFIKDRNRLIRFYLEETNLAYLFEGQVPQVFSVRDAAGKTTFLSIQKERFRSLLNEELDRFSLGYPTRRALLMAIHRAYAAAASVSLKKRELLLLHEHSPYGFEEIEEDFPRALNIITVRDPRNSYVSYVKMASQSCHWLLGYNYNGALEQWQRTWLEARRRRVDKPVEEERTYFLKTESLNHDPLSEVKRLADWLGIPFCETLLAPTLGGFSKPNISEFRPEKTGFDPVGVSEKRWSNRMSFRERYLIEKVFEEVFSFFRYESPKRSRWIAMGLVWCPDGKGLQRLAISASAKLKYALTLSFFWTRVQWTVLLFRKSIPWQIALRSRLIRILRDIVRMPAILEPDLGKKVGEAQ